jgi:hypothetical protein
MQDWWVHGVLCEFGSFDLEGNVFITLVLQWERTRRGFSHVVRVERSHS